MSALAHRVIRSSATSPAEGCHRDGAARAAYNLTRVMTIMGTQPLVAAMRA